MKHYVARQPILDSESKLFAYELLFRSGLKNLFEQTDGDQATGRVIADSFLLFSIEEMTGRTKAFINFTRRLLVQDYALVLPKDWIVVEVLEDVAPDAEVIAACRRLKDQGYLLALDDFVYAPEFEPLLDLADIVKVDFTVSGPAQRAEMAEKFTARNIALLAEKVETKEEFQEARDLGYSYFQGYFFSRPTIISRQDVPATKLQHLRLLQEINKADLDFEKLEDLIRMEMSLTYKLLRLVNSAAFPHTTETVSVKQALGRLGEVEVRKWMSLLILTGMSVDKPTELLVTSLIRARFCELAAPHVGLESRRSELFLLGLFSLLDAMVDRPLGELLDEIMVAEDIKRALLGEKNKLRYLLGLIVAFERGRWRVLPSLAAKVGLAEDELPEIYQEAVSWPHEIISA